MKIIRAILLIFTLTFANTLPAQTGEAAENGSEAGVSNWQNVFFGIGVAAAAVAGIVITAIDDGKTAH